MDWKDFVLVSETVYIVVFGNIIVEPHMIFYEMKLGSKPSTRFWKHADT